MRPSANSLFLSAGFLLLLYSYQLCSIVHNFMTLFAIALFSNRPHTSTVSKSQMCEKTISVNVSVACNIAIDKRVYRDDCSSAHPLLSLTGLTSKPNFVLVV